MDQPSNHKERNIKEEIIASIKEEGVKMRSKKYFFVQAGMSILGIVILFIISLFFASFVTFHLFRSGLLFAPTFGAPGWLIFFKSLPWIFIGVTLILVFALEAMLKRYSFTYRRPLLYSVVGVVALTLAGGFFISQAHFHEQLQDFAKEHRIRGVGRFYKEFGPRDSDNLRRGMIIETMPGGFVVQTMNGETSSVWISSSTRLPFGNGFVASDSVIIFGTKEGQVIQARGARKVW